MTLATRVLQVRDFAPGESVSYGRTHRILRQSRIAAIAIGYGHGYSRLLSSRGEVLVRGRRVPIVGRVTMDTTMVDVTAVPGVEPGDEVVLFGKQGTAEIRLEELAAWQGTINYEVTCVIGRRVARVYREGGREVWVRTMVGESAPAAPATPARTTRPDEPAA
jgi:alanine racemase